MRTEFDSGAMAAADHSIELTKDLYNVCPLCIGQRSNRYTRPAAKPSFRSAEGMEHVTRCQK